MRAMCLIALSDPGSGHFPAPAAEPGDDVDGIAERGDVGTDDVDAGDLAVFDLGDAGLTSVAVGPGSCVKMPECGADRR